MPDKSTDHRQKSWREEMTTTGQSERSLIRSQFFLLLLALVCLLVAYPFWNRGVLGIASLDLMLWGVLLASIYAMSRSRSLFVAALLLGGLALAGDLWAYLLPGRTALLVSCLFDLLFLGFATLAAIGYVMREERVGADKIFGAICGYIMIGLVWALVYNALEMVRPGSFSGVLAASGAAPHFADVDQFLYYSLVTLSTLGYGDIVAISRPARSLSATEAIVGQVYLAVLVARLIGLHIIERRNDA